MRERDKNKGEKNRREKRKEPALRQSARDRVTSVASVTSTFTPIVKIFVFRKHCTGFFLRLILLLTTIFG